MDDQSLPAPTNDLIHTVNAVIDYLVEGLGADAAITIAETQQPWLKTPFINWMFRGVVVQLAASLDLSLSNKIDKVIIRYQATSLKKEYDQAIEKIKKPGVTNEEIQKAKDSIDAIVNRSRH